jgi:hypothetical protein
MRANTVPIGPRFWSSEVTMQEKVTAKNASVPSQNTPGGDGGRKQSAPRDPSGQQEPHREPPEAGEHRQADDREHQRPARAHRSRLKEIVAPLSWPSSAWRYSLAPSSCTLTFITGSGFARAQSCGLQVCGRRPVDLRTKGEWPPAANCGGSPLLTATRLAAARPETELPDGAPAH